MKVLVADDHRLFREGLRHVLDQLDMSLTLVEAGDFEETIVAAQREQDIDIVLLDLTMPGGPWEHGFELLQQVLPGNTRVVILSACDDRSHVRQAMALGASGFISKTSSSRVMLSALRLIMAGGVYLPPAMMEQGMSDDSRSTSTGSASFLTPRQREVMELLAQGRANKEIARALNLAEGTVKLHVTAILKALNVNNRTRAVVVAAQLELAHCPA
jgi:DNA-binding NarL/FixJ family response regulator